MASNADQISQFIERSPDAQMLLQRYASDPAVQRLRAGGRPAADSGAVSGRFTDELNQLLGASGLQMPHDFFYSLQNGQVQKEGWFGRNADWIVPLMFAGAGGYGALAASGGSAGAGAGASATASSTLPSTQIGAGFIPAVGGTGSNVGAMAGGAAAAGSAAATLPSSQIGNGMAGPIAGGTGRALGGVTDDGGGGFDMADTIRRIAQSGVPIGAMLGTRALAGGGGDSGQSAISPELQQMLAMSMRRMSAQEPLFQAVNRQAFEGLPSYVKGGR